MHEALRSPLALIVLAAVAATPLAASLAGACEKDADCKPPRVCQSRKCVSSGAAASHPAATRKHHRKHAAVSASPAK